MRGGFSLAEGSGRRVLLDMAAAVRMSAAPLAGSGGLAMGPLGGCFRHGRLRRRRRPGLIAET